MSVGIISNDSGAVLYCTTSDWAFGPVFRTVEHAESFLEWLKQNPHPAKAMSGSGTDPREFSDSDLAIIGCEWRAAALDADGEIKESLQAANRQGVGA